MGGVLQLILQDLESLCDQYLMEKNEFVFNRKSNSFHLILSRYQGGKLHFGDAGCPIKFVEVWLNFPDIQNHHLSLHNRVNWSEYND